MNVELFLALIHQQALYNYKKLRLASNNSSGFLFLYEISLDTYFNHAIMKTIR